MQVQNVNQVVSFHSFPVWLSECRKSSYYCRTNLQGERSSWGRADFKLWGWKERRSVKRINTNREDGTVLPPHLSNSTDFTWLIHSESARLHKESWKSWPLFKSMFSNSDSDENTNCSIYIYIHLSCPVMKAHISLSEFRHLNTTVHSKYCTMHNIVNREIWDTEENQHCIHQSVNTFIVGFGVFMKSSYTWSSVSPHL